MDNYIYQNWDITTYKINCLNLDSEYIIHILKVISENKRWLDSFSENFQPLIIIREIKISAYIYIERFYNISTEKIYLDKISKFKHDFDFTKLVDYFKNIKNTTSIEDQFLIDDFCQNYKTYQENAIIKSIIE